MPERDPEACPGRRTGAIVLAAGASTRMGAPKQLLEWGGNSLVVRSVEAALGSGAQTVFVVLGSDAGLVQEPLAGLPAIAVLNPDWTSGMASSVRVGLSALLERQAGARCPGPSCSATSPRCRRRHLRRLFEAQQATGRIRGGPLQGAQRRAGRFWPGSPFLRAGAG